MSTTKKTANKQTSHQKKSDTKEKTSATKTAAVPIANNNGPKDEEQIWFTRLKELLEKKTGLPEKDKFTEHMGQLYDDLLKELCKCCSETFEPLFPAENEPSTDSPPKEPNYHRIAELEKMNKKNEEQIVSLQKENKRLEDKVKDLEGQKTKAHDRNNVLRAEKESLQTVVDGIKQQKKSPDEKVKEIEEENERLRDRLSQVAGSKLPENNPAIADLPDPNRPTQLGERFSELYDDEWTDAMEALGNAGDEKSNIITLKTIVEKSYEFGKTRAAEFVKGMEQALINISNSIQVDSTISKFIKAHRKNVSLLVTDALYQAFRGSHTEYNVGGDAVKAFMKKTVALCWLMAIQDPPVVLSTKKSGKLDTNFFRHYTKIGDTVDFVVWPVVYLHEGGPVICKGVAQGK